MFPPQLNIFHLGRCLARRQMSRLASIYSLIHMPGASRFAAALYPLQEG